MSRSRPVNQETPTPTPTITLTPTATLTPTPNVVVYATMAPGESGEGQATAFEYRMDAGQLLIALLLFIGVMLNIVQLVQAQRSGR
jgi:hypothetical protein